MKFSVSLLFVILCSCSSANNDLMTKLINEKKVCQDSIDYARFQFGKFADEATLAKKMSHDTLRYFPLADSATVYYLKKRRFEKRVQDIEFSIDSLSKMK